MPEYIRALIVILVLSTMVFLFARKPGRQLVDIREFNRRRNLWYGVTIVAFLSQVFWVYVIATSLMLTFALKRENNPVALFFMLLFAVPASQLSIPGLGVINYLFALSHQRLLSLILLFPIFLSITRKNRSVGFGKLTPDKFIAAYILLIVSLSLRETSVTDTLRQAFYQFIDVFLPYFVVSRAINSMRAFQGVLLGFVLAVMVMALIAVFEATKFWLVYTSLENLWGIQSGFSRYGQLRAGFQRPEVTVGSIPLGYLMATAIGFFLYLQQGVTTRFHRIAGLLLLLVGLLASLSRGPWVGGVIIILVFVCTGRHALRRALAMAAAGSFSVFLIALSPAGDKLVELLPFIGDSDQGTISYREQLLENAIIVIGRNPWFGSTDYLETAELESLRQGQGIVDIVNTYIQVSLESGLVGLAVFCGFFALVLNSIYKAMKSIREKDPEMHLLGRALFATLAGVLLIIFTVSSVSIVPIVYWSVAGLGMAYTQLVKAEVNPIRRA